MKKAVVAIDAWKLATFKRVLDKAGFAYTEGPGLSPGTLFLTVKTATIAELQPVVERAQRECRA